MHSIDNQPYLNQLFLGYQQTPYLWLDNNIANLRQLPININTDQPFTKDPKGKQLRLGKWVEKFVSFQLHKTKDIKVIYESLQIRKGTLTLGELDHLFMFKTQPIHLEVVYKFYLYDPNLVKDNPLAVWIGPNRKDRLIDKLDKLSLKQLPILYHPNTKAILDSQGIAAHNIMQYVCFKAKLFVPLRCKINTTLNPDCIVGHYINFNELIEFKNYDFYIPKKLEWLMQPHSEVNWFSFNIAHKQIMPMISKQRSPMVWVKSRNGSIKMLFVTWW